ncbi:MAG: hypothetical protein Q7S05_04725 [bacterium]|nr:hypothetical protein [bacterium]
MKKKRVKNGVQESLDFIIDHMAMSKDIGKLESKIGTLETKIDKLDTKLGKFEETEVDKRKLLEVKVGAIEKHLGFKKHTMV